MISFRLTVIFAVAYNVSSSSPLVNGGSDLKTCLSCCLLQDNTSEDITCVLYDVFDFIEEVRKSNGRVFVHCSHGVSRSASLVIAYLIWFQVSANAEDIGSAHVAHAHQWHLYPLLETQCPLVCIIRLCACRHHPLHLLTHLFFPLSSLSSRFLSSRPPHLRKRSARSVPSAGWPAPTWASPVSCCSGRSASCPLPPFTSSPPALCAAGACWRASPPPTAAAGRFEERRTRRPSPPPRPSPSHHRS